MKTSRSSTGGRPAGLTRLARELRAHPNAAIVPPIGRESFTALREDINRRGIQVPLEITDADVVLDGHLRLQVALGLGLAEVPVRIVNPPDGLEYLLMAAVHRRQLEPGQRIALVLELELYQQTRGQARARQRANLKQHASTEGADLPPRGKSRDFVAAAAGTSPRTAQNVITVKDADPELYEQIRQGRIAPDRAARQVLQRRRDEQLDTAPPLPDGLFDLTLGDPPWRLPGSPDSSRAVENHYPTMPLDEIIALEVPAADDAILFLWAVNSKLPEALQVIEAWGFGYTSNFAWVKDRWGLGSYNRCQHELLLIATRGRFRPPPENKRVSSVITAPRTEHSAKPPCLYEMLEAMYPRTRKLELFARGKSRPSWTAWGNQADPSGEP
jgi:N6-adenosine-specific RNA methylase IME4/ParB-like chromosome segregation protein Spo0J